MAPSNAAFAGPALKRNFRPEFCPDSAAGKSDIAMFAATVSLCHLKWPVAAKLLAIDGQASENSTASSVSVTPWAESRMAMVPSAMRISENDSTRSSWRAFGCSARASVSTSGDQLVWPSAPTSMAMCGLISVMSPISMRPASSGIRRRLTIICSTATAGSFAAGSPSTTSENDTMRAGNTDIETGPRRFGSSPVAAPISAFTASLMVSTGMACRATISAAAPAAAAIAMRETKRFTPVDPIFTVGRQRQQPSRWLGTSCAGLNGIRLLTTAATTHRLRPARSHAGVVGPPTGANLG